jgi:hypothetical protein
MSLKIKLCIVTSADLLDGSLGKADELSLNKISNIVSP